jgi:hypothetical protein
MTRGVRLYLVGSFVLVSMAGCGKGLFQAEQRDPWRAEAEVACMKSGAVREGAGLVRIEPISGPGVCGAEFPLKVAALGESNSTVGFADESLRPPGSVGGPSRWPVQQQPSQPMVRATSNYPNAYPHSAPPAQQQPSYGGGYNGGYSPSQAGNGPVSLNAPGVPDAEDDIHLPAEGAPEEAMPRSAPPPARTPYGRYNSGPALTQPQDYAQPRLGPGPGNVTGSVGPVELKPTATLACPIVSQLDKWLAEVVQPAAMRWFGQRVVSIRQISAYSCRGMNGNSRAHISEHAFGNALDIAAFTFADGRNMSIKNGWKGLPEEQGFLRDVQGGACQYFSTVLAPGSNIYHYDHIHVDLMRRPKRPSICKPAAVSGEEVASRAMGRSYAGRGDDGPTGSIKKPAKKSRKTPDDEDFYENE